ncbi:hypothetical protein PSU4_58390 [Pseudonocardia sulfidoxydans NBRC 16205]|uniref:Outer membrane protein assembly factor BamB n=1 Tax=Pseudonocardia sulfidoxydans NBRC 16205 TaxID=1223511 RepID=A0A511DPY7_9PSEU|nr:hypothetical protein PSU4_58390 [Pseudonocardia sulfidoxydans NBRC 16205]
MAALVAVLVAAGVVVGVVAWTRPDCTLTDMPFSSTTTDASAPDLSPLGLTPGHMVAADRVVDVVSSPEADVVVSAREGGGGIVTGYDAASGVPRWSVAVPGAGVRIAVADGRVVGATLADQARVFGLDAATGDHRFCAGLGAVDAPAALAPSSWAPVTLVGSTAVTAWTDVDGGPRIAAVDAVSGEERWNVEGRARDLHPAGDAVLTGAGLRYDLATGASSALGVEGSVAAADAGSAVLTDFRADALHVADARAGGLRWTAPLHGSGPDGGSVLAGGVVVTNDFVSPGLRGLDGADGTELWRRAADRLTGTSQRFLVADGDTVWAGGIGDLGRFDARTSAGEVVAVRGLRGLSVSGDGRVVVRLADRLVSYTPTAP